MASAQEIMQAVAALVKQEGKEVFSREDVRLKLGVDRQMWEYRYTGIFQLMRSDGLFKVKYGTPRPRKATNSSGELKVGARYKDVFRRVEHGKHTLTEHGRQLIEDEFC
ncbi:MAG: hypothetical protein ABI456_11160 [Ktedonobacteraceae bacterium]|nr:hypothetical protein [Chloroflexota bacterium]